MYESENPEKVHTYAMYRDKKTKELRAVRTTHLYETGKVRAIEKGHLKVEKFRGIKYPSGVLNKYTTNDINGKPLTYRGVKAERVPKGHIPRRQAKRIKDFAKKPWKKTPKTGSRKKNLYKSKKIVEIKKSPGVNVPGTKEYFLSLSEGR